MQYDPSLIKKEYVIIDGKKVPLYKCPTGMQGKHPQHTYTPDYDDQEYAGLNRNIENQTPELMREFDEYVNEGISPNSDEVLSIKEEIEKEHFDELLDPIIDQEIQVG